MQYNISWYLHATMQYNISWIEDIINGPRGKDHVHEFCVCPSQINIYNHKCFFKFH